MAKGAIAQQEQTYYNGSNGLDLDKRHFYDVAFKGVFLEKTGDAFQQFFAEIMTYRFQGDYIPSRPWGNRGDRKNDGYLKSKRQLFQVYAPNTMEEAVMIKKMEEDFHGAIPYWEQYFDDWIFVHNSRIGLGPVQQKKLLELDHIHKQIQAKHWCYGDIRAVLLELKELDIMAVVGSGIAPSEFDVIQFTHAHLDDVLVAIALHNPPLDHPVRPVPADKIAFNRLTDSSAALITQGMKKTHYLGNYFQQHHNPQFEARLAAGFGEQYYKLRAENSEPDEVFARLHRFSGGAQQKTPQHEAAVLTVLAYFFEKCDIFERPTDGHSP